MPHALYMPVDEKTWYTFYQQKGNGFDGMPYQRGYGLGSVLGGLFRSVLPMAKSALKSVGKEALRTGVGIASDVLSGQDLKTAAETRAKHAGRVLLDKAQEKLEQQQNRQGMKRKRKQTGRGLGQRPGAKKAKLIRTLSERKQADIFSSGK